MNTRKLRKTLETVKTASGVDYAIYDTDSYGDCSTCATYALAQAFGEDATGIHLKHWNKGMNKSMPLSKKEGVYLGHSLTEEQAKKLIQAFKACGYRIEPEEYDEFKCFWIEESNE